MPWRRCGDIIEVVLLALTLLPLQRCVNFLLALPLAVLLLAHNAEYGAPKAQTWSHDTMKCAVINQLLQSSTTYRVFAPFQNLRTN